MFVTVGLLVTVVRRVPLLGFSLSTLFRTVMCWFVGSWLSAVSLVDRSAGPVPQSLLSSAMLFSCLIVLCF